MKQAAAEYTFALFGETIHPAPRYDSRNTPGEQEVAGRNYLRQQAEVLLKLAKTVSDPKVSAAMVRKAADVKSQLDESMPAPDQTPRTPDVEPRA